MMFLLINQLLTHSFDEISTASTVNLGMNSLQTESNTGKHSSESGGRTQG